MYDISWKWEESESAMFFSTENPQGSTMFKYKIKDYYPSNSPLNTITCTITDKERNLIYTKSINLNFGTAGTSGTDGTLEAIRKLLNMEPPQQNLSQNYLMLKIDKLTYLIVININ